MVDLDLFCLVSLLTIGNVNDEVWDSQRTESEEETGREGITSKIWKRLQTNTGGLKQWERWENACTLKWRGKKRATNKTRQYMNPSDFPLVAPLLLYEQHLTRINTEINRDYLQSQVLLSVTNDGRIRPCFLKQKARWMWKMKIYQLGDAARGPQKSV